MRRTRIAEVSVAAPIKITREDLGPAGLGRAARYASSVAASRRMLALALVMEGAAHGGCGGGRHGPANAARVGAPPQ